MGTMLRRADDVRVDLGRQAVDLLRERVFSSSDWPTMYCRVPKKRARRSAMRPNGRSPHRRQRRG
jgi:hypothetical protein